MTVQEIILTIPNEPGKLGEVTDAIGEAGINLRAMDIALSGNSGAVSLVVDDHERGMKLCKSKGYEVDERKVLVVWVPDTPGGLNEILKPLRGAQINVEKLYLAAGHKTNRAAVVMEVNNIDDAVKVLEASQIDLVRNQDDF